MAASPVDEKFKAFNNHQNSLRSLELLFGAPSIVPSLLTMKLKDLKDGKLGKFPATIFSPTAPTPNFWRSPFVSRRFHSPATGTAPCPARAVDVEARQWSTPGGKLCSSSLRPAGTD